MADNVAGRFYVGDQCLDCDACREIAPEIFARNDEGGYSYVKKQPETPEEEARCREAIAVCCTDTIHDDGDRFDPVANPPPVPYYKIKKGTAATPVNDQRAPFRMVAASHRHDSQMFSAGLLAAISPPLLMSILHFDIPVWAVVICALVGVWAIIGLFRIPRLQCPACSEKILGSHGRYCPECGGQSLSAGFMLNCQCANCGKYLNRAKGRNYRVRYCTGCGAYLDEKGL